MNDTEENGSDNELTLIVPCVTIVLLPVFRGIDTLFFFA